jgi:single-stranded-DNA-specific exonuclease
MLAGVGIAFKVAQALRQRLPELAQFDEASLLDLVAIGTVADLAPLLAENRQLVIEGLQVLNLARRPGIRALAELARLKPGNFNAESIAFGIGPRINAAGRLAHAYTAARLLYAENGIDARRYAQELNKLNQDRQHITADQSSLAEELVDGDAPILFATDSNFLSGVVGLVASRLAEKHYRPAIVIEEGEEESRGSCRSIAEFHITAALDAHADLLVRHGGHAAAAGFTIRNEQLPAFIARMTETASAQLDQLELSPSIEIDAEIDITTVDQALYEQLLQLEPTGMGNPAPIFVSRDVVVGSHRAVGRDGAHLQLQFVQNEARHQQIAGIAFRQGAWAGQLPPRVDIVYTVGMNEWNGNRNLQLVVQDIKPAT